MFGCSGPCNGTNYGALLHQFTVQELESRKRAPLYQKKQEEEAKAAAEKAKAAEERAADAESHCKEARVSSANPSTAHAQHAPDPCQGNTRPPVSQAVAGLPPVHVHQQCESCACLQGTCCTHRLKRLMRRGVPLVWLSSWSVRSAQQRRPQLRLTLPELPSLPGLLQSRQGFHSINTHRGQELS